MAIETTALGFQKPDGNEPVKQGDNVIAANAQKAEELHAAERARLVQLESAAGFTGTGLDLADAVVNPLLDTATTTRGKLDARYVNKTDNTTALAAKVDKTTNATDLAAKLDKATYTADTTLLFAGVAGYAYGNSWIASPNYAAIQYPLRLPAKLGFTSMTNNATSGYRIQDTAINAIGTVGPKFWNAGTRGVVIVGDLLNNMLEPDDQRNRDTALESTRALVALLGASSRVEETAAAFTYSAGWSVNSSNEMSAGATKYFSSANAEGVESTQYVDIAVPAGVNYLTFWGLTAEFAGAVYVMREGAVLVGEISGASKAYNTPWRAVGSRSPVVYRVPGTTARTIRVTTKRGPGTTGNYLTFIDAMLPQSTTPPLIVLVKPVPVTNAGYQKPALLAYLRSIPDTVAAEFGSHVLVIDPAPGWNPATMLGADLLHPNEAGQEYLAETVARGVKAELYRRQRVAAFGALV